MGETWRNSQITKAMNQRFLTTLAMTQLITNTRTTKTTAADGFQLRVDQQGRAKAAHLCRKGSGVTMGCSAQASRNPVARALQR